MIILENLIQFFSVHYYIAYLVLFLGGFFDTLIGTGFFVQGEIFFLAGAVLAGMNILNVWLVFLFCVLGGILGDNISYFLGREYGNRIQKRILSFRHGIMRKFYDSGKSMLEKFGDKSPFYARLLGPISWVTPFLSGFYKMDYNKFFRYNILGVLVGVGNFVALGYLFGTAYKKAVVLAKDYIIPLIILLIVLYLILHFFSKKIKRVEKIKNFIFNHMNKYGIIYVIIYLVLYICILYFLLL